MRILYSKLNKPWLIEMAATLDETQGVEACYWVGLSKYEDVVRSAFPSVIFHRQEDAIRGLTPPGLDEAEVLPVDRTIMHGVAAAYPVFFQMIRRFGYGRAVSVDEALDYSQRQIAFWNTILQRHRPDAMVCWSTPHNSFDFLLYELCRQQGIRTVVIRKTSLPGIRIPSPDLSVDLSGLVGRTEAATMSTEMERYLERLRGSYQDAMPAYMRGVFAGDAVDAKPATGLGLRSLVGRARRFAQRALAVNTAFYYSHGDRSRWEILARYNIHKLTLKRRLRRLQRYYLDLTRRRGPDPGREYVLFALHLEPESTTCPDGDVFADQALAVELLAKLLPPDWLLYVRENPKQLKGIDKPAGGEFRSRSFYERLGRLPNVRFLEVDKPPFEVVDSARAVATITGTIGWEAVVRGKPTLVFGNAWYKDCPGVFHVPTVGACTAALDAVRAGYTVSPARVDAFVSQIEAIYGQRAEAHRQIACRETAPDHLAHLLGRELQHSLRAAAIG